MTGSYRRSGATLPYGDLLGSHGVAMEGYFWRLTDVSQSRVLIALTGVQRTAGGSWGLVGYGAWPGFLRTRVVPVAAADVTGAGVRSQGMRADATGIHVDLGPDARLDVRLSDLVPWPRRGLGGSSVFQSIPALNQYWHPWLLGGRAHGTATVGGEVWDLDGAQVYAEKNWGRGGFPGSWWWGQAQGFADEEACVAFAGGPVQAGPLRRTVTGLVVRLPDGRVVRLGNPGTSPVTALTTDATWTLRGQSAAWRIDVDAWSPPKNAHVLPVPLVQERRAVPGAIEHLAGNISVRVRRWGRLVWEGHSMLAGLEHGGLARAAAELRRRGVGGEVEGAPPES